MKGPAAYFLALFLGLGQLSAQNKELLYDFVEIPQALMLNPGMQTDFQWHAGVPGLSGVSLAAGSSGLTVYDLFADDGLDFTQKVRDRAVFGMKPRDEVSATYQVEILNGGFRSRNRPEDYYSFGIYHEGDVIVYWPRDLAILGFEGNADQLGRRFNLGHLKTRGEILNVFHFGVNRRMSDKLTLGARAKLYSGIIDFNSSRNTGYFVTTRGQNNLLANMLVADMFVRTSGLEAIRKILDDNTIDDGSRIRKLLMRRGFLGGDLGLGIDLGFSYDLNERTLITGSVLDLGFIYHHTDPRNFNLQGRATTEGIEVILPDALDDPNADFWQELVDEIEGLVPFEENNRNYITFRPTRVHASLRYNFGQPQKAQADCDCDVQPGGRPKRYRYANSLGGQLYVINRPRGPQTALTAFYQHRFGNLLSLKGTYTVDKFSLTNLGLGMSLQAGPVNFYILADNLLAYSNLPDSHYASLQLGLNILSWGRN